jgi:hypothetical protein
MRTHHFAAILLCLAIFLAPVYAQTTSGAIVGTVTDPSGAIIGGATVTITNMGTNISVKTTSDASGEYVVTPLELASIR